MTTRRPRLAPPLPRELSNFSLVPASYIPFLTLLPPPPPTPNSHTPHHLVQVIDDFAFFKAGVKPEWEDPTNKDHGCLQVRKALSPSQLDHYWQNLLLALIGESLDPADVIAGARVVDKGSKSGVMYRMELWLKVSEPDKVASLRERLEAVIADGTPSFSKGHPKFEWKKHNDKK